MKEVIILLILFIPLVSQAQNKPHDELPAYIDVKDQTGKSKKVMVVHPPQILIIEGDSIYTILNEFQLRRILEGKEGFDIINHPDSIQKIIGERIKSIILIKSKGNQDN